MQKVKKKKITKKNGVPYAKGLVVETLSTVSEKTALLVGIFSPLILVFKKDFAAKTWLTAYFTSSLSHFPE